MSQIISAAIAAFVVAFLYQWYNYVLFQFHPFGYWLAYGLAFVTCWCLQVEGPFKAFLKFVLACVFFTVSVMQILSWAGAAALPLFSLFVK